MKGLVCKFCGYISLDGKTDICPVCYQKEAFEEKDDAYKTPDTIAEKGESEKKHIPSIKIKDKCGLVPNESCIGAKVKIGEIIHPMTAEHSITGITFYLDKKFIARVRFTTDVNPAASVSLKPGSKGKFQAIGHCNLHGNWLNEIEIG